MEAKKQYKFDEVILVKNEPIIGGSISFGNYNGQPISWIIYNVDYNLNTFDLLCMNPINFDLNFNNDISLIYKELNEKLLNQMFKEEDIKKLILTNKLNDNVPSLYLNLPTVASFETFERSFIPKMVGPLRLTYKILLNTVRNNSVLLGHDSKIYRANNRAQIINTISSHDLKPIIKCRFFLRDKIWNKVSGKNWMSLIKNEELLDDINIPGTHDSCCCYIKNKSKLFLINIIGGKYAKNQQLNIEDQLNLGVRLFDIRCVSYCPDCDFEEKNRMIAGHGEVQEFGDFKLDLLFKCYEENRNKKLLYIDSIFDKMINFLKENPSECILFCFNLEIGNKEDFMKNFENIIVQRQNYIYKINDNIFTNITQIPRIMDCRGKILLLDGTNKSINKKFGMIFRPPYNRDGVENVCNKNFFMENTCRLDRHNKFSKIKNIFLNAKKHIKQKINSSIIYLSSNAGDFSFKPKSLEFGMVGDTPEEVASQVNPLLKDLKINYDYGWIFMDFANIEYIQNIYKTNLTNDPEDLQE